MRCKLAKKREKDSKKTNKGNNKESQETTEYTYNKIKNNTTRDHMRDDISTGKVSQKGNKAIAV